MAVKANPKSEQQQLAIDLRGIGLRRGDRWILKDIDWQVRTGTCAAVLGPNGSGKSTLTRILACHLWPTQGECAVLGQRFGEAELAEIRKSVRLLQPAGPYDVDPELTALEVVLTGFLGTIGLYHEVNEEMRWAAQEALRQVGLSALHDHAYSTLSSGERVRSLIARGLVVRPGLLLLDEPTAGLDLLAREQILGTVQALFEGPGERPTVVMITHHLEELPPATAQVLVLSEGRAAAVGRPEEVLTSSVLSKVYRCPVEVRRSNGRFYPEVHPEAWRELLKGD